MVLVLEYPYPVLNFYLEHWQFHWHITVNEERINESKYGQWWLRRIGNCCRISTGNREQWGFNQISFGLNSVNKTVQSVCHIFVFSISVLHPRGRTRTSDYSNNSFIMTIYDSFSHFELELCIQSTTKQNFLIDNHYKTICRPVRSECSSYRVFNIDYYYCMGVRILKPIFEARDVNYWNLAFRLEEWRRDVQNCSGHISDVYDFLFYCWLG